MSIPCPWSEYGCKKQIKVSKRKTHVKEEFTEHALLRFEWERNEREQLAYRHELEQKEIHSKVSGT